MLVKDTCYSLQGRKHIINQVQSKLFEDFQTEWNLTLFSDRSIDNNNGGNKLRTYRRVLPLYNAVLGSIKLDRVISETRYSNLGKGGYELKLD